MADIERHIVEYPRTINKIILEKLKNSLKNLDLDTDNYEVRIKDLRSEGGENLNINDMKDASLKGKTLGVPIKADIDIIDKKTGKIVNSKTTTLLRVPTLTDHFSFIVDGTEYTIPNQLRIREGVYTRLKENKDAEANFNLAKGRNFSITMDPKSFEYKIEFKNGGKLPLFPILEHLGVNEKELEAKLGRDIVSANSKYTEKEKNNAINKFKTIVGTEDIKSYLKGTVLDPETTEITLGKRYDHVNENTLMDAAHKLVKVIRGEVEPDNRDKLVFKRLVTPEDILVEALEKRSKPIINKLKRKIESTKGEWPQGWNLNKAIHGFITTSQLSNNPEQINPVEFLDRMSKITYLGEGGISSTRAVPLESRNVQDSYPGFIDLIRTSESQNAGMDLRAALTAAKGKDGYIYSKFYDIKNNKHVYLNPKDLEKNVVAFPEYFKADNSNAEIPGIKNGKFTKIKKSEANYVLPHGSNLFSVVTGALPFLNNNSGNRINMASKFLTQALSLENREVPYIRTVPTKDSVEYSRILNNLTTPFAPEEGKVIEVKDNMIKIKGKSGKVHKVNIYKNYPLSRKTMIDQEPIVKVGDTVKTNQPLVDSNYSKNGHIALGTHLKAAYVPYKGFNHEDGIVISETAAKKLTSLHMYKKEHELTDRHLLDKDAFKSYYPTEFEAHQLDKLDEQGVVKPGTILKKGDPYIVGLEEREPSEEEKILGKLSKSFLKPKRKYIHKWDKDTDAEVVDVAKHGKKVVVTVKTKESTKVGDKLAVLHGGKGVITKILPDDKMPKINGEPAEMLLTPLGILSRINPGQIYELLANKVAEKTGKPIKLENFKHEDMWKTIDSLMKKYNISDKELIEFPENGKKIKATAGPIYTLKLFKQTDTNYSARDFGTYDQDERPVKGGEKGAKSVGMLDLHAYISHGAPSNLIEISAYKGTKNDDFWNAIMLGKPIPMPKESFTTRKFLNMLKAGGINYNKDADGIRLLPMTDKETEKISSGEIKEPKKIDQKFKPEEGGIFDYKILGGLNGERWGHINLPTKIVNPVYETPVKALLGKDTPLVGEEVYKKLKSIKIPEAIEEAKKELENAKNALSRDTARKKLKALFNLKKLGFDNPAEAYVISKVPVLPPKFRPITIGSDNKVLSHDSNYLYTDLLLMNKELHNLKKEVPEEVLHEDYNKLYGAVKALYGLADPVSTEAKQKNIKGFISFVTGGSKQPKESYFQAKVLKKTQDLSGRATAVTDATYGLNEIGIPKEMGLTIYKPFIVNELVKRGEKISDALKLIEEKHDKAYEALKHVAKDRPVIANRAPTLWKHNIMAFKPRFIEGKSIVANGLILPGFNLDFDGDTVQVYVPATEEARKEAVDKMMPSKIPFNVQDRGMMFYPRQEALMGLYKETEEKK